MRAFVNRVRRSYPGVAATLALVLAIGGGTAVALKGKNSVDSGDIKNHQVKASDLAQPRVVSVKENPGRSSSTETADPCAQNQTGVFCGTATLAGFTGWVNAGGEFAPVSYWQDSFGIVHLHGEAKSTWQGLGFPIFVLPAKVRPARTVKFAVSDELNPGCSASGCGGDAISTAVVSKDGVVDVVGGDRFEYSLDGIEFPAK